MDKRILTLVFVFSALLFGSAQSAYAADETDSIGQKQKNWVGQLFDNGFRLNDPSVNYPAFPRFCLKVYNWGDRTFNSYDPAYVVSTGKNWKAISKTYNWAESYLLDLGRKNLVE